MPAIDTHPDFARGMESPADNIEIITPHDGNELEFVTRAISIATAGSLCVVTRSGLTRVIPSGAIAPGVPYPIRVRQVKLTGTSATGITGLS